VLFGTLAGKDVAAMAEQVAGFADTVVVTGWPSARAADPRKVATVFADRSGGLSVQVYASLPEAYEAAVTLAGDRGAITCFGSIAFVAAVREYVLGIESDALGLAGARQE
jgi:folylpolyglutamate synthase/dihydropteroate synthase